MTRSHSNSTKHGQQRAENHASFPTPSVHNGAIDENAYDSPSLSIANQHIFEIRSVHFSYLKDTCHSSCQALFPVKEALGISEAHVLQEGWFGQRGADNGRRVSITHGTQGDSKAHPKVIPADRGIISQCHHDREMWMSRVCRNSSKQI